MKKILCVVLTIILIATSCVLLVACTPNDELYDNDLVKDVNRDKDVYTITLKDKQYVDTLVLSENADKVTNFGVYGKGDDGKYQLMYKGDRIDKMKVCALDGMTTNELRIEIFEKKGNTKINSIKAYNSTAEKRTSEFRVSEYLVTSENKLKKSKNNPDFYNYFKNVDDIILIGEISLDTNGEILYGEGKEDFARDINNLNEIKINANNPDMNIVVSVGLRTLTTLEDNNKGIMQAVNEKIDVIVKNIAKFAEEFKIQGIDFDWEYPQNSKQWKAYSKLIVEVNKGIKDAGRYVTVALPPWGVKFSKEAVQSIKYVNLMTYDLFDKRGDHASFYNSASKAVNDFLNQTKFKPEQVYLGLSFYGRSANKSENAWPDMNWDYSKNNQSLGKWGNYIKDFEYIEDGVTKYSGAYINGYAMNRDKTLYAISKGLGGVMIFRMSCDAPASYEYCLHNAVAESLQRGLAK